MIVCDLARMALMFLLAAVAAAGLPIALAPVIAAAATAAAAPYMPCVAAVTPRVVDDADLPGANAARSAVGGASIILGPALGGVLMFLGSPAVAFALNALTFGLSALAVLAIRDRGVFATRRPAPSQVAERPAGLFSTGLFHGLFGELAEGAAALRAAPGGSAADRRRHHVQLPVRHPDRAAAPGLPPRSGWARRATATCSPPSGRAA